MKSFFPTLTLAVVAAVLSGCQAKHEDAPAKSSDLPTAAVGVQTAERKSRTLSEDVVGTVRAKQRATLEARVNGRIEKLPVRLGEKVRQGRLVARLEAGEMAARLEQAESSLEQAERDGKRAAALLDQQSITRAEFETAQSRQRFAKAAVLEARTLMGYLEVTAPFDGVVTKKWVDVGDLAAPGKPLVELADLTALQIDADLPEATAARVKLGSRLEVRVDTVDRALTATVSEIAPGVDSASRTLRVKLDLPVAEGLMPGQFARLTVPLGECESLRVPASAVLSRGQLDLVFSVVNQRAHLRLVTTGRRLGEEIEILSGLDAGDSVVVRGAEPLTDGQPVEAK